jgi:hypothetical protein
LTEKYIYPKSWQSIVEKHADSMTHDNPENHWWVISHMENLAESLWKIKLMNTEYEMCSCKHFGGNSGLNQQHKNRVELGHGQCTECDCRQFTWIGFCDENGNISS